MVALRPISRTTAMAGLAVIVLAACGSGATTSSDSVQPDAGSETSLAEQPAVSVEAPTASGSRFDFATTEGRDVLLWFWAPW